MDMELRKKSMDMATVMVMEVEKRKITATDMDMAIKKILKKKKERIWRTIMPR